MFPKRHVSVFHPMHCSVQAVTKQCTFTATLKYWKFYWSKCRDQNIGLQQIYDIKYITKLNLCRNFLQENVQFPFTILINKRTISIRNPRSRSHVQKCLDDKAQQTLTSLKSTLETLEKGVNYVQSWQ